MAKKILIIEDEYALVKSLKSVLSQNYKVESASSGKEGIKKATKNKPDLVLLDLLLPDMFGLEILKQLKKDSRTKDIPVIVLTNLGNTETVSKIIQAGGQEYLIKSDYTLDEVVDKIGKVFSQH